MRTWAFMLGGMIVWTIHFFALYIVASIFLTSPLSRLLTGLITLACFAADGVLLAWAARRLRGGGADGFGRWQLRLAALMAAVSLVAVFWQGLPALLA